MKLLWMLGLLCGPSLIVWALGGFVMWNWNPAEWTPFVRFVAVILSAVSTSLAIHEERYRT